MSTLSLGLYSLALLGQVLLISIHIPRRILGSIRPGPTDKHESRSVALRLRRYLKWNRVVAVMGVAPLMVAVALDARQSPTPLLVATGVFFLLQMSGVFHSRDVRRLFDDPDESSGLLQSRRLPLGLVTAAVIAYTSFVVVGQLHPTETTTALMGILTLANVSFALLVGAGFLRLRFEAPESARRHRHELRRSIGVLAVISIGLSAYFFGKDVLRALELTELRPLMTSLFLQALAAVSVYALTGGRRAR